MQFKTLVRPFKALKLEKALSDLFTRSNSAEAQSVTQNKLIEMQKYIILMSKYNKRTKK